MPERKQTSEFDCRAMACDCEQRRGVRTAIRTPAKLTASRPHHYQPWQKRADVPAGARRQQTSMLLQAISPEGY